MFDIVTDLHLDNGMHDAPAGMLRHTAVGKYKTPEAKVLLVGGDTSERRVDTVDFLNVAAPLYERVVAVWGNHEQAGETAALDDRIVILDEVGNVFHDGSIAYVGGCPRDMSASAEVAHHFQRAQVSQDIDRVVLMTHYVPSPRLSKAAGRDIGNKAIALLERLSFVRKPTLLVFGHVHLRFEGEIDGMRFVANPRGYRGKLRDGSTWSGTFQFEP